MLATVLLAVVALIHVYIVVLEMFLWTKPRGLRIFGMTKEKAETTAVLAMNQGLYNGFLVAGLVWGIVRGLPGGFEIDVFFLSCVLVAGVFGAFTASRRILYVQAMPAAAALVALFVG